MNRRKPYGLYIMLVLAALWIVFFLCAPYIAPYNPEATNVADRLQDISSTHWLGTDQLGRDGVVVDCFHHHRHQRSDRHCYRRTGRLLYATHRPLAVAIDRFGTGISEYGDRHCLHRHHGTKHNECDHFAVHY